MSTRPSYRPTRDLIVETVRVGVPIETKEALTEAARRAGTSASAFARKAVEDAIRRERAPRRPSR